MQIYNHVYFKSRTRTFCFLCFRCCFSFQNARKTFCKRTGCLWFVTLETSSTRFGQKRLPHVISTCPFQVLLQFTKRQEDVLQTYWASPVRHAGHVFKAFQVETSSTRYQYVSVSGVASGFPDVRKTFCKRTGRFRCVSLDTCSTRCRQKRLSHVIRTCPYKVLLQFLKRQEDVL